VDYVVWRDHVPCGSEEPDSESPPLIAWMTQSSHVPVIVRIKLILLRRGLPLCAKSGFVEVTDFFRSG